MGEVIGQIGDCCCAGDETCPHLRVTARLRWTGYVAFNLNPAEDVITVRYRRAQVTTTIAINGDYDAFTFCRPPTEEELTADPPLYERPEIRGRSGWGSTGSTYPLFNDPVTGAGINWVQGHFQVGRTVDLRLWGNTTHGGWRPIGQTYWTLAPGTHYQASTDWVPPPSGAWLPSGTQYGCMPMTPPQFVRVEGYCMAGPYTEILSTQPQACCPGNGTGETTDPLAVDEFGVVTMGNGCPPGVPGYPDPSEWTGTEEGNWKLNMAQVAFHALGLDNYAGWFGSPDTGYPQVSEDGLTLTYVSTDATTGDVFTQTVVLSEPWTLAEALGQAEQLLNQVGLDAGETHLACNGDPVTLGCSGDRVWDVLVTEDPVCVDGDEVQPYTVGAGLGWPDNVVAARTRVPSAGPGCGQYLLLTKSRLVLPPGLQYCATEHEWTDDVNPPTDGDTDCAPAPEGADVVTPDHALLSPDVWGQMYYEALP